MAKCFKNLIKVIILYYAWVDFNDCFNALFVFVFCIEPDEATINWRNVAISRTI